MEGPFFVAAFWNDLECVRVSARLESEPSTSSRFATIRVIHDALEIPAGSGELTVALLDGDDRPLFIQGVFANLSAGDTVTMSPLSGLT